MGRVVVDTRTDVYSLGVTLYELLTLQVPFTGATTHQIFRRIRLREPEPPRRLNPAIPRDLEKICLTAMEKDPARRYASAREMKEDLERFLAFRPVQARPVGAITRGARLVRRNPAMSTSIALAVLLVIGGPLVFGIQNKLARERLEVEKLRTERQRDLAEEQAELAEAQRARAMRHLRRAQDAADRFLADVAQVELAAVPEMEPVRKRLLEETLRFYEDLAKEEGNDPGVRSGTARAWIGIGDIQRDLGHPDLALEAFTRAREILAGLAAEEHVETSDIVALARAITGQAGSCVRLDRPDNAERSYREAIEAVVARGGTDPEDPYLRVPLVIAHRQLGALLAGARRFDEAEAAFREAERHQQALVEAFPDKPEVRHERASLLMQRGGMLWESGRADEAESDYRKALALLEDLARTVPTEPTYRLDLSTCCSRIGSAAGQAGRIEEARDLFERAVAVLDDLASSHPLIPQYRANLARDLGNLGQAYELLGRLDEAKTTLRRAIVLREEIGRSPIGDATDIAWLARLQRSLGDVLETSGDFPAAIEAYRAAVSAWETLVARNPELADPLVELGGVSHNLALLLREHGGVDEARALTEKAVACEERALDLGTQDPRALRFLGNHLHLLVEIELSRGRPLEALPVAERLLELEGAGWQLIVLARVHARCASFLAGRDDPESADEHVRAAFDALERAFEAGVLELADLDGSDLESLRGRDEFRRLRERLEGRRPVEQRSHDR